MSRIFFEHISDEIVIDDKLFHYLVNVMKKKAGDSIFVFDGKSGEYIFDIANVSKKSLTAKKNKKIKDFSKSLDIWLLFAPIKKEATDFVIEKATELGVNKIIPIITKRVNNHNFNQKRAMAQVIEAAEQSERQDIPEISEPIKLNDVLKNWDKDRALIPMLERSCCNDCYSVFNNIKTEKIAIMVGPEGGFDDIEKEKLMAYSPASMGARILRAETACIAALAIYQAVKGDFR